MNNNDPPAHLLLGSDAMTLVAQKVEDLQAEHEAWKEETLSTDFAEEDDRRSSWA